MNTSPTALIVLAAAVLAVVGAMIVGLHRLGEAKDRWIRKLTASHRMTRLVIWSRQSKRQNMVAISGFALIGAVLGAIVFTVGFLIVRAQQEKGSEPETAAKATSQINPPPNLVLHTYEAGSFAWHNDAASGGICVVASIGNCGSASNARNFSFDIELADGSQLPGEITALSIPEWQIKDARFGFDLTLRQEDALSEKAFKNPIIEGAEVTGFILAKFPKVRPDRLSSLKTMTISFEDVCGRKYRQLINPKSGRESRRYYAGTRLNQPPNQGNAPIRVTEPSFRLKFSDRQTVQVSSRPGDYTRSISLDGAATLLQGAGVPTRDSITMILPNEPPLTIDQPKAGEKYQVGGGTITFPDADKVRGAQITGKARWYRFSPPKRSHDIPVGDRVFRVSLQAVNDKSKPDHMFIEYVFGISEQ